MTLTTDDRGFGSEDVAHLVGFGERVTQLVLIAMNQPDFRGPVLTPLIKGSASVNASVMRPRRSSLMPFVPALRNGRTKMEACSATTDAGFYSFFCRRSVNTSASNASTAAIEAARLVRVTTFSKSHQVRTDFPRSSRSTYHPWLRVKWTGWERVERTVGGGLPGVGG